MARNNKTVETQLSERVLLLVVVGPARLTREGFVALTNESLFGCGRFSEKQKSLSVS